MYGWKPKISIWTDHLKKLDQKRCGLFRILKNIGQEAFQLKLLKEWMIYNVFNENLLIQCKELQFKGQHMELAPLLLWEALDINNFYFIFFYFFWFYIDFLFLFFFFWTMKRHWHWSHMTDHMETTWWPWVENKMDIRI